MLIRIDESRGLERIGPVRQVRFEVLRKPLGMGFDATLFAGDEDLQTRHVVAFRDTEPIGCLTLMPPELRSGLADYVAQLAESQGWELWCNARLSAVPFYRASRWCIVGDEFDISGIGPHYRMEWRSP